MPKPTQILLLQLFVSLEILEFLRHVHTLREVLLEGLGVDHCLASLIEGAVQLQSQWLLLGDLPDALRAFFGAGLTRFYDDLGAGATGEELALVAAGGVGGWL